MTAYDECAHTWTDGWDCGVSTSGEHVCVNERGHDSGSTVRRHRCRCDQYTYERLGGAA